MMVMSYVFIVDCILFFSHFVIVVQVQLSPFSTHHSPPPHPSPLPTLGPTPLWLCPCVLYICS